VIFGMDIKMGGYLLTVLILQWRELIAQAKGLVTRVVDADALNREVYGPAQAGSQRPCGLYGADDSLCG